MATEPHAVQVISSRPVAPGYLLSRGAIDPDPPQAGGVLDQVAAGLAALRTDPTVGNEAMLRRGVLLMARDNHRAAVIDLRAAVRAADPFVRYLAAMMMGIAEERDGRLAAASLQYREAFDITPASSAALAQAASLARDGRGEDADRVIDRWTTAGRQQDPWREYSYRDYRLFPDQLARMRALLHP